jgi:hypothetical protein
LANDVNENAEILKNIHEQRMHLLLYSGILYLIGIGIILALRPDVMFMPNGNWKEFGIGRNSKKYTWLPFWLFAIIWAIASYIMVMSFNNIFTLPGEHKNSTNKEVLDTESLQVSSVPNLQESNQKISVVKPKKKIMSTVSEMKPGYYVLDINETTRTGIPRYIFLGDEPPNMIYNEGE